MENKANKPDMSVVLAGVTLKNPVITASGTCGFGKEYAAYYMPNEIGAITVKGLTLQPKAGNPPPRIAETTGGILNSIGLQNPGVEYFLKNELPRLKRLKATVIANIAGSTIEDYCKMAEIISNSDTDMIEMNISCPNVKEGGVAFGTSVDMVSKITSEVKKHSKKPLIVKLSPNVTDICEIAVAAEQNGADVISLINTLLGMRIDIKSRKPILANNVGGLSGSAVFPIAVRMVWQVRQKIKLPIIGMGGITNSDEAIEMMLAGADAIAIGTASFLNPYAPIQVCDGLERYLSNNNMSKVSDLSGKVISY